jgi:DNA-damage-inducible protein J
VCLYLLYATINKNTSKELPMIARRQTSIKVDAVAWDSAKEIFKEYNLIVTDAINIFLNRVRLEKGLPFEIKA